MLKDNWFDYGLLLIDKGDLEGAIMRFDKALKKDPLNSEFWVAKGITLTILCRDLDAAFCFNKVLEINPQYSAAWAFKGVSLLKLGQRTEALNCLKVAIAIDQNVPEKPLPFLQSMWGLTSIEGYTASKTRESLCIDKVLETDLSNETACISASDKIFHLGWQEKFASSIDKLLETDPNDKRNWIFKGVIYYYLGKFGEAVPYFERALKIEPDFEIAQLYKTKSRKRTENNT